MTIFGPESKESWNKWVSVLLALFAFFIVMSTVYCVFNSYHAIPTQDQWLTVDFYQNYLKSGLNFGLLWAQHNEHRILLPRIFILLDYRIAHGTGYLLLVLILLLQAAHVLLLCRSLWKEKSFTSDERFFFCCMAFILSFWLIQSTNFIWSFQITWILNGFFASLAAFFVCRIECGAEIRSQWKNILLAAACCAATTYSLANGILMCGVLGIVIWKAGLSRKIFLFWVVFTLLLAFSYFHGYHSVSGHSSLKDSLHLRTLNYVFVYLGNPVSRIFRPAGILAGILGLGLFFFFFQGFLSSKRTSFYRSFSVAVAAYIVLTAGITALGRNGFGLEQATSSRYFTPVLLFWFFMATLTYASVRNHPQFSRGIRLSVLVALLFFVLALQIKVFSYRRIEYLKYDEGALGLMVGVQDSLTGQALYPVYNPTWQRNEFLRRNQLSVYHEPWTLTLGRNISEIYAINSSSARLGEVHPVRALNIPLHEGYYVNGKIFTAEGTKIPKVILFTSHDTIVGYAKTAERLCRECFSGYVKSLENRNFDVFGLEEPKSLEAQRIRAP